MVGLEQDNISSCSESTAKGMGNALFIDNKKNKDVGRASRPLSMLLPFSTFVLILFVIIFLTVFFKKESEKVFIEKELENLEHSENLVHGLIDGFYKNNKKNILFLSYETDFLSNLYSAKPLFEKQIRNNNYYRSISIVNGSGNVVFGVARNNLWVGNGFDIISNGEILSTEDVKKLFWYAKGEVYFSDVYTPKKNYKDIGVIGLKVATRISNAFLSDENLALVVDVDFGRYLKDTVISRQGEFSFYLFDETGNYLINPGVIPGVRGNNARNDFSFMGRMIDENIANYEIKPDSNKNIEHIGYYSLLNFSHYGAENPLRMITLYDHSAHFSEIKGLSERLIYTGVLLALISLLITWFITRYLLSPLKAMSKAIDTHESEVAIHLLPTDSSDEVGVMARSFYNLFKNKEEREAELFKTRNYVDGITHEAPVLLSYVDIHQKYQFVNSCYEQWSGLPAEQIVGHTLKEVMSEKTYNGVKSYVDRVLQGETVQFKSENAYGIGGFRYVQSTYKPQIDACGNVQGFYVCVEDVTQNTLDSKKIHVLSQRLDFALETPGIGVWDYDLGSGSLFWDDRMYDIYHTDRSQFFPTYESWLTYFHPDDLHRVKKNFDTTISTKKDFVDEFRVVLPNKEIRWIAVHGRVIIDEILHSARVIGTNLDITNRKELEIEKEQALVKAEESAKLKSEFLASMSHEIRTPMNGVLGMLDLLKNTDLDKQQTHYATLANSSAQSLLTLINDILDFSKVEAGKMELDIIDFHLPNMLGEFSESVAHRAQEKGIEVVLDFKGVKSTFVKGDPSRIRQILTNLVGNAIKFTDEGEVTLSVELTKNDSGYLQLHGVVSDTGIGIPEEKLHLLFDSFSQVDASTTRKYGGTGLGLAIVKKLCQLMQGDITVKSTLGVGSQFIFSLLLEESEQSQVLIPPVDITAMRILVGSGNQTNVRVVGGQLREWGADVIECDNGSAVLEVLENSDKPFVMTVLDTQIPDIDGESLGKNIRQQKKYDDMHLVLMTSLGQGSDAHRFAELGFSAFFPKPATANDLFNMLNVLKDSARSVVETARLSFQRVSKNAPNNAISHSNAIVDYTIESNGSEQEQPPRLLLVEDNAINQEVALGILTGFGLTADIANDGIEALEMLNSASVKDHPYDLILMDCQMPRMDGYETTHEIRSGMAPNPDIPIIAMTANAMKGDREKCIAAGMSDYVTKPIEPETLINTITQWSVTTDRTPRGSTEEYASMTEAADIWNREDFMRRIMNNEVIANKLIDLFKTDTPKTIEQLAQAVEAGQAEEAGLLAHKLKGSVSNLGGIELASLALKIEQAGKGDDLSEVKALWPQVQPQYDKLLNCIESHF